MLSKQLFTMLRHIPSDRTFSQSPFFDHKGYVASDQRYHSLDLSSATDRFPLKFQKQVLGLLGLSEVEISS